jgi:hypothetical protein
VGGGRGAKARIDPPIREPLTVAISVAPVALSDGLLCLFLWANRNAVLASQPVSLFLGATFEPLGPPAEAFWIAADFVPFCARLSPHVALSTAARARRNTGPPARKAVVGRRCGRVYWSRRGSAGARNERENHGAEDGPEGGGTHRAKVSPPPDPRPHDAMPDASIARRRADAMTDAWSPRLHGQAKRFAALNCCVDGGHARREHGLQAWWGCTTDGWLRGDRRARSRARGPLTGLRRSRR